MGVLAGISVSKQLVCCLKEEDSRVWIVFALNYSLLEKSHFLFKKTDVYGL